MVPGCATLTPPGSVNPQSTRVTLRCTTGRLTSPSTDITPRCTTGRLASPSRDITLQCTTGRLSPHSTHRPALSVVRGLLTGSDLHPCCQPATSSTVRSRLLARHHLRHSSSMMGRAVIPVVTSAASASSSVEAALEAAPLPVGATDADVAFMRRAIELAQMARGKTSPNPMVGCVIVKDGSIIGEGFHPKAGEPHAEVFALRMAGADAEGATAYVTLEPCNHFGRTPPCSQALVKAKVKRVVVGTVDPNPLVGGKGVGTLRKAGIEVVVGVEEAACQRNVEAFMFRIVNQRPFATLRYTMSMDGRLLSSLPPSGPGSHYSKLLEEYDAVVVTDAALLENPGLNLLSHEPGCKQPLRVVLALSLADLDQSSSIFDTTAGPVLVVTGEAALAEDVQRSSATGIPAAETWLRGKGVEVVVVGGASGGDDLSPSSVLDLCFQRGAFAVLWDSLAPAGSGLEGFLGRWAMEEGVVEKMVVSVSPTLSGNKGEEGVKAEGFFSGLGESVELERVVSLSYPNEIVLEGYIKRT